MKLGSFDAVRWLRRHRNKIVLLVTVLVGVAVSPVLAFLGPVAVDAIKERANRLTFDSAEWKRSLAENQSGNHVRLRMVDDLLRRYPLVGLSRDQTVALLGAAPATSYFKEYDLVYWLGPERGFMSVDSEWLAIHCDPAGRVDKACVVRD